MSAEDRVQAGDKLGSYELLNCVARGGMAAVWAARHHGAHGFSRVVAVKTMLPSLCDDAEFQQMFLGEARVAARIRHPNVVETLDLGEEQGLLYLVMEWIDGETMSAIMKSAFQQGGVPLAVTLRLIIDTCAGLHAAHELCDDDNRPLGLVHRDVSPPNVIVSYSGMVKLADFGIAKTIELNNACTMVGRVKGKLRYMAPEQLVSASVDRRADVFAIGVSLYQLTTGHHPWPGESAALTIRNVLSRPPTPPSGLVDRYPIELERIVQRALARHPAERFQTAADMARALEEFARGSVAPASTREVGSYLAVLLDGQGAARRAALREALRVADRRNLRDTIPQRAAPEAMAADERSCEAPGSRAEAASQASLRPWTSSPCPSSAPGEALGIARDRSNSFVERSGRARSIPGERALLLGAALLSITAAYALGGRSSSVVDHAPATGALALAPWVSPPARAKEIEGIDGRVETDSKSACAATSTPTDTHAQRRSGPDGTKIQALATLDGPETPAVQPRDHFRPNAPNATIDRARRSRVTVSEGPKAGSDPDVGF